MAPTGTLALIQFYKRGVSRLDARLNSLLAEYVRAEDRILSMLLASLASQTVRSLRDRRRKEVFARQILRGIEERTRIVVPDVMNQAGQLAVQVASRSTGEDFRPLSRINRDTIKLLTENLIEDLGHVTQTVGRNVEDVFRKEALKVALEQVPDERPRAVAVAGLHRALSEQGITAFVDRAGRHWTLKRYSQMAANSTLKQAIGASQSNLLKERGFDIIEINKSRNPCDKCKEHDGKTYSLTGRAPGIPHLELPPPFHPDCEHFFFASRLAHAEREASGWIAPADLIAV